MLRFIFSYHKSFVKALPKEFPVGTTAEVVSFTIVKVHYIPYTTLYQTPSGLVPLLANFGFLWYAILSKILNKVEIIS